jgi:membrane-associated phospholipid phosphatase
VGLLIAYELMRDLAPVLGVAPRDLAGIERWLSGGGEATLALQSAFYHPAWIGLQDCLATAVYFTHFVLPAVVGLLLWLDDRGRYQAFAATLLVASFLAFLTYLALPTMPPWLGHPQQVHKVIDETIVKLRVPDWLVAVYSDRDYNIDAAFPSLHSAFPLIATVHVWRRNWRWGLALAGWTAVVWLSVVYLGEHYVVDILGGIAYAAVALLVVAGWHFRRAFRRSARAASVAS